MPYTCTCTYILPLIFLCSSSPRNTNTFPKSVTTCFRVISRRLQYFMYSTVSRERENLEHVVISFLLSFLFPFLSPFNHSIAARCSRYCHCHAKTKCFLLVFPVWATPSGSGTPAPCCASNLESDRNQFPDFLQPLPVTVRLLYVVCTNLSLRGPPQKSGSTTVILCVSNMHPVVHFRVFLSAFSPFRAYLT